MDVITDAERAKIKKEAQNILEKFSAALSKVKIIKKEKKEEVGGFREEGKGIKGDADFRERMFANAPLKNEECIIAEKKKW
ncbi:MAG: hypothetical protein AABY00_02990 [Nanoarchaeota archaeon]